MLSHGCIVGWMSPALLFLQSENSPLETGPLTTEEISWVGSILCMGAFAGSLTTGYIAGRLGCKRAIIFLAIPGVVISLEHMLRKRHTKFVFFLFTVVLVVYYV